MARIFAGGVRLLAGVYLLASVLLVAASAPVSLAFAFGQYTASTTIIVGMGLLFVGLISIALARLEKWRVWTTLLATGFVATVLSSLYAVNTDPTSSACSFIYSLHGFPLFWNRVPRFYQPATIPPCPLPTFFPSPRLDWSSFFLDTIFYAGAGFSLLEIVRGIMQARQQRREGRLPF